MTDRKDESLAMRKRNAVGETHLEGFMGQRAEARLTWIVLGTYGRNASQWTVDLTRTLAVTPA